MSDHPFRIVEILYPGLTQLDFTAPHTIFSMLPGTETIVASLPGGTIEAEGGLAFAGTRPLPEIEACDVLFLPGGLSTADAINDLDFMAEVRRLGGGARYLTSVCTGSLILGAAGFLKGKRAACHWAWRDMLALFGAIPDPARVVRDGHVITGGGVTAGIDCALTIAAELAGEAVAQSLQLIVEYAPAPPFQSGRPETAPAEILAMVQEQLKPRLPRQKMLVEAAAARLSA